MKCKHPKDSKRISAINKDPRRSGKRKFLKQNLRIFGVTFFNAIRLLKCFTTSKPIPRIQKIPRASAPVFTYACIVTDPQLKNSGFLGVTCIDTFSGTASNFATLAASFCKIQNQNFRFGVGDIQPLFNFFMN